MTVIEAKLNDSPGWKRLFCAVMLILLFSGVPQGIGLKSVQTVFSIAEFVFVAVMLPELWGEIEKCATEFPKVCCLFRLDL